MPDALDEGAIVAQLAPATRARLRDVDVLDDIDSTNAELMRRVTHDAAARVLIAESQSEGRGRRGKAWASPPGANLYLSLAWRANRVPGLSIAMGIACAQAIGLPTVRVKWPNDLVADGRKLGGLLVELSNDLAVIGVGLNVRMPRQAAATIEQPWTDLATLGVEAPRNVIAAQLIDSMVAALVEFDEHGLPAFAHRWRALDALAGRAVTVTSGDEVVQGIARGLGPDGALRIETAGGVRDFHSADVSVRAA